MTRELLSANNYIKLNAYLYLKNIKSDIITGNFLIVDIRNNVCSYLTLNNKFLFFKVKPKLCKDLKHFNNIIELSSILKHNNKIEEEFKRIK